jgi:type I restriction enzyme, S subunit
MKRLELTNNEIENFSLKEDDLLFARRSLVAEGAGKCSIVREVNEPTVFESSILRARPDSKKANRLDLYYLFQSNTSLACCGDGKLPQ